MVGKRARVTVMSATFVGMALALMAPIVAATAQQTQRVAAVTPEQPLEARRVTVDVENAHLTAVLRLIAQQAGLVPVFNDAIIPARKYITLHVRDMRADNAFREALRGTNLAAQFQEEGHVVIVRDTTQAQSGVVTGTVVDSATRRPIPGVSVAVVETRIVGATNEAGAFRLTVVPAGQRTLTFRRLGYSIANVRVAVESGQRIAIVVAMKSSATALSEVVTTATGDRSRLEVGNSIGTIKADSVVATTLLRNMADLLTARTPGVVVSSSTGAVGAPSKIRIRGMGSIGLNNDPIVILDGVRITSQTTESSSQTNTGRTRMGVDLGTGPDLPLAPSRLDDIDPSTIESIDVLRGPSASSLYGTDAANGVIVIKTKRGKAGPWRLSITGDQGWSEPRGVWPETWWAWNHTSTGSPSATGCTLAKIDMYSWSVEDGSCTIDSLTHYNAQNDPRLQSMGVGSTRTVGGNVSGGNDQLQQFLSLRYTDNVGGAKMSDVQKEVTAKYWTTPVPSWMRRPNTETSYNGSSRTTFQAMKSLNVSVTVDGIYRNVLNGGVTSFGDATGSEDSLAFLPAMYQRAKNSSIAKRGLSAVNGTYQPLSWLTARATVGGDYTLRTDDYLLRASDCTPGLDWVSGMTTCASIHTVGQGEVFTKTADVGLQLSFAPLSWLDARTAIGEQYNGTSFYNMTSGNDPNGTDLSFGSNLLSPAPITRTPGGQLYSVTEERDQDATAGWYLEQTAAIRNRLFFTAGFRRDAASAFGANVNENTPVYPKFNMSWLLSDEPFFPRASWLTSLRLRGAYGYSGKQASQRSVLGNYRQSRIGANGTDSPGLLLTQVGNPDLKPERSKEFEAGFDLSLKDDRVHLEASRYRKVTQDAISNAALPPSYGVIGPINAGGFSANLMQTVNLGSVENKGIELSLNTKVLDRPLLGWDVGINVTKNTNTLLKKNPSLPSDGQNDTQLREGYPLNGYWGYPVVSYADANGDGWLQRNEIVFGNLTFMGAPYPKSEITYLNDVSLLNGTFRLHATIDQINGLANKFQSNANVNIQRGMVDPTAPLAMQAAAIQALVAPGLTGGYIGTTTSVRLAELSLTYTVSPSAVRRLGARTAAITLAGRNLALWSTYVGNDPNVDGSSWRTTGTQFGGATLDQNSSPPAPRQWAIRINLGY